MRVWGWPLILATLSVFGLLSALLGQGGIWWILSWIALATPLAVILWCVWPRASRALVPMIAGISLLGLCPGAAHAQAGNGVGLLGVLPPDLSPWSMFLGAGVIVKIVMVGLALASVTTWTVWLVKTLELRSATRQLNDAYRVLLDARTLGVAGEQLAQVSGVGRVLVRAASTEWQQSADALEDREGLKERIASHLERIEAATGRRMLVGTGILATIGATAPFVGLFGTVWGIMNSFIGISKLHATNLAVVAPGIAEALLATACGLVAAIPAVIIYNHFARQIAAYKSLISDIAAAVLRLASRDLSRRVKREFPQGARIKLVE